MAKLIQGILSGKVGNLIAYNYRGVQTFRALPKKTTKPPTDAQQAQRMRLTLAMHFLTPLKSLISKGYGNRKSEKSQFGQCIAYHTKHAITGAFPNLEIDYSKVVLTTGHLWGASNGEVSSNRKACIDFSWIFQSQSSIHNLTDKAILIVYSPSEHRHVFMRTTAERTAQHAELEIGLGFSKQILYCWIVFVSEDGKQFSTSQYLGTVTIV